jgi:hypothetical protein
MCQSSRPPHHVRKHADDGDIVSMLIDGYESTRKTFSRKGDQITLTPIERTATRGARFTQAGLRSRESL